MEDCWENIISSKSLGKDESDKMLEEKGQV
jgi:hypothetical protein